MFLPGTGWHVAPGLRESIVFILLALAPVAPATAAHITAQDDAALGTVEGSRHLLKSAPTAHPSPRTVGPSPGPRPAPSPDAPPPGMPIYNTVMAWQQVSPLYSFARPGESPLLEAARVALSMGMPTFKFTLDVTKYPNTTRHIPGVDFTSKTLRLRDVVSQHPDVVQILDMPFKYFVMWAYTPGMDLPEKSIDRFVNDTEALHLVYHDFYNLTDYLVNKFTGTGKTFLLGNWEGDWALVLEQQKGHLKNPLAAAGMVKWMQARQSAVDAAKAHNKPSGVEVYNYLELNHVHALLSNPDFQCAANLVLPYVAVDFVSLSCYDVMGSSYRRQSNTRLMDALNLLEQRIPNKTLTNHLDPTGQAPAPFLRRTFIGEYGYRAGPGGEMSYNEAGKRAASLAKDAITWGVPFCLYWQLYNNDPEAAARRSGWMLVDPQGNQLPTYKLHQSYTSKAQAWVQAFQGKNDRLPTPLEFAKQARYFF